MFLAELKQEEKKVFLELVHLIANSNGIIDEAERKMLDAYDRELGIDLQIEDLDELKLSEITLGFLSETSRRIAFVEAIAVAFADGVYDENQKLMIQELREAFGFSTEYYEEVKNWMKSFFEVYKKGYELTHGETVSV